MAPRTAKGKKAADVKLAENEAPKKGRGKAKVVEDPEPDNDTEDGEMVIFTEKKTKRGKKATNDANGQEQNGKTDEAAPPAKKGRKKNVEPVPEEKSNDDMSAEDDSAPTEDNEQKDEDSEVNSHTEEPQAPSGRGRKKQVKKETEKSDTKPVRGRKPKQEVDNDDKEVDEKPKTGRGRGRKPPPKYEEADSDVSENVEEEAKPDPPAPKGRKKGPAKAAKEKSPESEKDAEEDIDEKPAEEPKKKETKGRKNQGKKAQAKDEAEDDDDNNQPASKKRKVNKKEDKAKEMEEDDGTEDDVPEYKPVKGRRGQKKAVQAEEDDEQDAGESTTKRRRKGAEEKASSEDAEKKAPLKNKSATDYESIDFSNDSKSAQSKDWNFKIASWNVDGIRAWMGKGGLDYIKYEKPDILCLQEVKCSKEKLPEEVANLAGYHAYWLCSDKDGYAGVGIYTTKLAMNVQYGLQNEELDNEGRIITAEYEQFYLICTYVPNAGRKLVTLPKRLQWNEEFRKHVKELDMKKPVIICGDMNVSHNEIDLANPKTNRKNAGFTDEERSGMSDLLGDGFVDTYRRFNPDKTGAYTFWTYMKNSRSKNVGWRLDYFIVSERLLPSVCDNVIRDQVYGSDHCPITLFLHLTSADKPKE